jgi:L-2-hydroxyglutarate oxidase LhgO
MLRIAGLRLDSPVVRRLCIPCFRFAGLSTECPKDCIEDGGDVDVAVIGAGVVGLAVARAAALAGLDTLLLEREATHGTGISSRHSEVIHAGLYYQPGSAKARLCLEGRDALYEYATARGVPHARMGKLVVATERE